MIETEFLWRFALIVLINMWMLKMCDLLKEIKDKIK